MKHPELSKWGKEAAKARYGAGSNSMKAPTTEQAPQDPIDKHGADYNNDASGWVRGMPSAEAKPGFDKHKAGR